jgi:HSP20 family molecular chaperone IbpA
VGEHGRPDWNFARSKLNSTCLSGAGTAHEIRRRRIEMTPQAATAVQAVKTSAITKPTESQQLVDRMESLYDSIARRAFEIFDGNGRSDGRDLADWLEAESELLHPVHLEISESEDALNVKAEVPGFAAKELDVQVEGSRLTISGNHESKQETTKGKTVYSERCSKEIFRSVDLPTEVDASKVNATLKDGILSIDLPKSARAKSVRVETKSAS